MLVIYEIKPGSVLLMNYSAEIKNKLHNLGFDIAGITTAAPFTEAFRNLQTLKNEKRLPDFINKKIRLITHPREILPGAQSIITVGLSYYYSLPHREEAFIARYARVQDYHSLIKQKLAQLADYLNKIKKNTKTKIICDNGPLLEKEAARRSGLGWPGKNTCLVTKKYGSFLVLGEIITDLELKPDNPRQKRKCQNCSICQEKCPTSALNPQQPYHLNYKHCVSFLTQKKGILTEKENKRIGSNLWGCDLCQEVCPYNSEIKNTIEEKLTPLIKPDLNKLLKLDPRGQLPVKWKKTALAWRGTETLIRNALIVCGNIGYHKYYKVINNLTDSRSQVIRHYSRRALKMF